MIEKVVTGSFFTNSYVISNGNECVVVDPGLNYSDAANMIKSKYNVKAILITHGHMDHIDGIKYFDVPVYIHELDKDFLFDASLSLYNMFRMPTPYKKGDLNIITVKDNDEFELIGFKFKVTHTPGHTRGSVCYSYGNKLLSGDTLFNISAGRTDFPTGNPKDMRNSLNKIINNFSDNVDVYPGHENKTTIKNERKNNMFIK